MNPVKALYRWPFKNVGYSLEGLRHLMRSQRNTRTLLLIGLVTLVVGFILRLNAVEFSLLIIVITLVIFAELVNTAIEAAVDMTVVDFHPKAKVAKDVGACCVLVTSLGAIAVGLLIFIPHIFP